MKQFVTAAGLIALWSGAAMAQTEPITLDKAAMERAQREADGPRRRILEAAQVKLPRAAEPVAYTTLAPARGPGVVPPTPPPTPQPALATLTGDDLPPLDMPDSPVMRSVAPVAPVQIAVATVSMISLPQPVLPAPRLLSMVDPDLPGYFFRRAAPHFEVLVDLQLAVDGSVAKASVRSSPNPDLVAPVLDAVRQWRYEPQAAPRALVVKLVIGPST